MSSSAVEESWKLLSRTLADVDLISLTSSSIRFKKRLNSEARSPISSLDPMMRRFVRSASPSASSLALAIAW
ncbi:MAG: hypothetical protein BWY86_00877 [Candidatus Aminicenantes bacterium ADurb.Bin508]|nr:MAG: hypothetical protein BWY86_00877 [Candidatus Aminicenantes bacterium ADurb.Bin508]